MQNADADSQLVIGFVSRWQTGLAVLRAARPIMNKDNIFVIFGQQQKTYFNFHLKGYANPAHLSPVKRLFLPPFILNRRLSMPTSQSSHDRSNHLFRTYQAGDNSAFDDLYRLWKPYIRTRVIRSNIPVREADDLVHDVFVRVVADASKWNVQTAGWWKFLDYKIKKAVSEYYRVLQTQKRQAHLTAVSIDEKLDDPDAPPVPLASDEPPAIDFLIFQERLQAVQAAILKCEFTEPMRTILAMKFADHDYAVISEKVDLSKDQIRKLLHTAIKTIRLRLQTVLTD